VAETSFLARGSTREVENFLANLTPDEANSPEGIDIRASWAEEIGNFPEFIRLKKIRSYSSIDVFQHWEQDVKTARIQFMEGDKAGALARLGNIPDEMPKRLEREPMNPRIRLMQAYIELIEGPERGRDALGGPPRTAPARVARCPRGAPLRLIGRH
jgi:hypothetical protein